MFGGWDGSEYQDGTWEWLSGWQGTGQTFGAGCGTPPLDLAQDPAGRPVLGQTARAFVSNATSVFTFVVFGWSDSVFGSFTLPLPLDGFGLPGCTLLQSAESGSLSVTLAGPTAATFELPIPNVGGLLGLDLSLQAWSNAPGANPGNTIVSNGLRWEVGSR